MAIAFADRLKKIQEQKAKLEQEEQEIQAQVHDELKKAALEAISAAEAKIAEVNALGYMYRWDGSKLVEHAERMGRSMTPRARKNSGEAKGTRAPSTGPCPICQFETSPHHDARRHRSQGENKKPFTAEELTALGLTKV